jgi:hypothetical protein
LLLDALNRHRGKGQQKVTIMSMSTKEGQAIVGQVEKRMGINQNSEAQRHVKQIAHASEPPMRSADPQRDAMHVSSDAERPMPHARRLVTGGSGR